MSESSAEQPPSAEARTAASPAESLPDLLVKAVRMLPAGEQDGVLRMLLDRHTATWPAHPWPPHPGVRGPWLPALAEAGLGLSRTVERGSGTLRVVPVRLSAEQHDDLKRWCEANDFSMAVVIRGLVDRFLDSQQRPHPSP
jgi:hypothetical protein